jgi:opacity protein-like surface antigen
MNLSSFSLKALTASLVLLSTTGLAFAKHHQQMENYKGERSFKDVPPCPAPAMLKDGFYLGAQAGYDSYRVRENVGFFGTGPAAGTPVLVTNPAINATGFVGGLFLGYGKYMTDMFYLGGEIFGNYSGADDNGYNIYNQNALAYTSEVKAHGSWGLAVLPGMKINDTTLGYIRLGWNWVRMESDESANPAVVSAGSYNNNPTNTVNGFAYGLGMETLLTGDWSLRAEYTHTGYSSFSSRLGTSFNPSDNQFMVGINWHFA